MATVDKALADEIIAKNGYYETDPRVQQVVRYDNSFGGVSYAILYEQDVRIDRYAASEYVRNPEIIWKAE